LMLVVQHMLRFMGAGNLRAGTDSGLLLGGYSPIERTHNCGRVNMKFLHLDQAPVNIETMFARTVVALRANLKDRRLMRANLMVIGQQVDLSSMSAQAWRFDTNLSNKILQTRDAVTPKMVGSARSSSLYNVEKMGSEFGSVREHMDRTTNCAFHDSLCQFFQSQGAGTRFHNQYMIGKGTVECQTRTIPGEMGLGPIGAGEGHLEKEESSVAETAVWLIRDPISGTLHDEIIREVNKLSFIGSSQDVGANTKKKSRYYRMATNCKKGGLFQLSSDSCLIECQGMAAIENKLVDLVSSLMEEQDRIVAAANPDKKMCSWVHDKTMCQVTVGTLKDSAYGKHNDCGFHHNHTISEAHLAESDEEKAMLLRLPSDGLMRVATLVLSTTEGTNATIQFTEPDNDKVVMALDTTHNCLHIQGYGCQRYLKHQVVPRFATTGLDKDDEGTKNGVRLVFSFRYSIDRDDGDLISALINNDDKLKDDTTRGDYDATGVVDAIEKGCRPQGIGDGSEHLRAVSHRPHVSGEGLVDPSLELVKHFVGKDKPAALQSDSIPCDQASVSESTKNDTTTFRDNQQLWTRVTSSDFLTSLNRHKIRVRVEHTLPPVKGEKIGRTVGVNMGRAPRLYVMTKYGQGDLKSEVEKILEIGDVLTENAVREHYGIPRNEHSSPPWSCVHEAMLNCIIVAQDYKNDYAGIRNIQEQIEAGNYHPNSFSNLFWVGGSGGAPEDYGNRPVDLSQIAMKETMPQYVLPQT
jgi:hypothetical protein